MKNQKLMLIHDSFSTKGSEAFRAFFTRKCVETDGVWNLNLHLAALRVSVTMAWLANATQKL